MEEHRTFTDDSVPAREAEHGAVVRRRRGVARCRSPARPVALGRRHRAERRRRLGGAGFRPGGRHRSAVLAGLGLRWKTGARLDLAAHGIFRTWSGANSDLLALGGSGSDNTVELSFGGEFLTDPRRPTRAPIRFGVHYATLPFLLPPGLQPEEYRRFAGLGRAVRPGPGQPGPRPGLPLALRRAISTSTGSPSRSAWRSGREPGLPWVGSRPLSSAHGQTGLHRDLRLPDERGRLRAHVRASSAARATCATEEPAEADVMLVNTCAVRDNAEQRVIGRMGELQRHKRAGRRARRGGLHGPAAGPGAAGAGAAGRPGGRARRLSQPPASCIGLAGAGQRASRHRVPRLGALRGRARRCAKTGPTAFVTVQRGCDYRCTFCIVPYTRGPERSRRLEDVVREVRAARGAGHQRGHAARADGQQLSRRRARLRRPAARGRRGRRDPRGVRFTSPYPTDFTDRGHRGDGHDAGGVRARAPAGAERLERGAPADAAALHPGALPRGGGASSGRPFPASPSPPTSSSASRARPRRSSQETLTLVAEADFDDAYTFKYSVREGTPAVRLRDHVPDEVASARLERLIEAVRANARRKNLARVGEVHEVLVERPAPRGATSCWPAPAPIIWSCSISRRRPVGEYHHVPAHRHHRLHLHRRGRHARTGGPVIRNLVEEHVRPAYESLRPHFPGLLRLRHLPGRTCWSTR